MCLPCRPVRVFLGSYPHFRPGFARFFLRFVGSFSRFLLVFCLFFSILWGFRFLPPVARFSCFCLSLCPAFAPCWVFSSTVRPGALPPLLLATLRPVCRGSLFALPFPFVRLRRLPFGCRPLPCRLRGFLASCAAGIAGFRVVCWWRFRPGAGCLSFRFGLFGFFACVRRPWFGSLRRPRGCYGSRPGRFAFAAFRVLSRLSVSGRAASGPLLAWWWFG